MSKKTKLRNKRKNTISIELAVEKRRVNEVLMGRKGGRMQDKRKKKMRDDFYE